MPHLFVNRRRLHDLFAENENDLRRQFRWETINAVVYKLGGLVFIAGSVFFLPRFDAFQALGGWLFLLGSLIYLVVSLHDFVEVVKARRLGLIRGLWGALEYSAAAAYLAGTLLFISGRLFHLPIFGSVDVAPLCFVGGGLLFVLGASINVLQIVQERSLVILQLINLTAITFVVGSVLFTVASVPYLWIVPNEAFLRTLAGFQAWQYLIGSVLFFLGGVFNYWRAYVVMRGELTRIRTASDRSEQ